LSFFVLLASVLDEELGSFRVASVSILRDASIIISHDICTHNGWILKIKNAVFLVVAIIVEVINNSLGRRILQIIQVNITISVFIFRFFDASICSH